MYNKQTRNNSPNVYRHLIYNNKSNTYAQKIIIYIFKFDRVLHLVVWLKGTGMTYGANLVGSNPGKGVRPGKKKFIDARTESRTDGRTHVRTDGRTYGRTNGRTDGRTQEKGKI